jgi:hypothetical protein
MSEIKVNHGIEAIAFYLNRFNFHGAYSFCKTKKEKQEPAASTHRQIDLL